MENIGEILKKKQIVRNEKPTHRGNQLYGVALDIERNLDLPLPMCFRLLKKYSYQEISKMFSWWKDYPFKRRNNIGLLYWKLKQLYPNK